MTKPIIVGIAGGTASGKTSVCELVFERIGGLKECTLIAMDSFYKELTDEEFKDVGKYNFDHPDAFDWELVRATMEKLMRYEDVIVPNYNYSTCKRDEPGIPLKSSHLVLFEGIFALFDPQVREMMDLKIFVHTDDDIRLLRRLKRDVIHRGRTIEGVIKSYNRFVKQSFDKFIKPTMKHSDIIVPRGKENEVAIQFITENLQNRLRRKGLIKQKSGEAVVDLPNEEGNQSAVEFNPQVKVSQDSALEKVFKRLVSGHDRDILDVHLMFLAKKVFSLFREHNPQLNKTQSYQYLNIKKESIGKDLQDCLEFLTEECENLIIVIPELVTLGTEQILTLLETLRQLGACHQINKIHIITPFLSKKAPQKIKCHELGEQVTFYTLYYSDVEQLVFSTEETCIESKSAEDKLEHAFRAHVDPAAIRRELINEANNQ